ncbi:MAG: HlyD family secretion protein [Novosphingobium sp.]
MSDTQASRSDSGELSRERSSLRRPLMIGALVIAAAVALWFYLSGGRYVETDNAQLQTGKVMIAANVSGRVISVDVTENQMVKAGQVLFRIDPASFQANLAQAEAQYSGALVNVGSTRADLQEKIADTRNAEAQLAFARSDAARQRALLKEGISSQAQVDQAELAIATAQSNIVAAQAKAASVAAKLPSGSPEALPGPRQASAMVQQARISLNDTVVRAPQDGIVTKVNQLQVGSYVSASRPIFVLTGKHYWIEANFKESQLRYMRLGQPAKVTIDAYPDRELKAHVSSFSPGTGNSFSVLPAENATGNWVKVTQRLAVEIALDEQPADLPLHAGLSVAVTVDTGHQRHLFGADTPPMAPGNVSGRAK